MDTFLPVFQLSDWKRFTTGCLSIDHITNGGIPTIGITEIYGKSGVGKTQFCLQLSITVQFPLSSNGLSRGKINLTIDVTCKEYLFLRLGAIYICTEDRFPAKRLQQMVENVVIKYKDLQLDKVNFQDNIFVEHIADYVFVIASVGFRITISVIF